MAFVSPADLQAFLDEALPPEQMAAVEHALRDDPQLLSQLAAINHRRDAGVHSVGEIWRKLRLSCPTREQLGSYLLGALPDEHANYIQFHIETVGCRPCSANFSDLRRQQEESACTAASRRSKYFQSTAGQLRKSD